MRIKSTHIVAGPNGSGKATFGLAIGQTPVRLTQAIEPFTTLPAFEHDPTMYEDLGAEGVEFKVSLGKGECAS